MDTLVTPVYRALKEMGWTYFKLDALRHLRYEGYNSYAGYFSERGLDREAVFRGFVEQVRNAIGRDVYLLACWGIRPELIGLVDGMRVGDDGFGYGSSRSTTRSTMSSGATTPTTSRSTSPTATRRRRSPRSPARC